MLAAQPPPGIVDQDAAHQARCDGEEVRAVLPVDLALVDEFQIGLVDQSRGLQCAIAPFTGHVARGDHVQLVVHQRHQAIEGIAVAALPVLK